MTKLSSLNHIIHSLRLKKLYRSVWLFPALITVLLLSLSALRISGTSIGTYHEILYGKTQDSSLLLNRPASIRSDEWLVTTQLTIAQHAAGYPRFNTNIDSGRDMTVVGDAPNKDWSTVFRPQNIAFLVLPFENAFAFKWWLLLYLVIISCYFFTLRILENKRLFAAIFSTAFGLSPFIFWWYTTGTLASIFYGFFIILLSMRVINSEYVPFLKNKYLVYSQTLYALSLTYLLSSFALVLYPPFQIPIAIVVAFIVMGLFLNRFGLSLKLLSRDALRKVAVFVLGIILTAGIILTFVNTRTDVINAISHTVYPGNRTVTFQGDSEYELLSTYLQPQLQRTGKAANYYTNQSEASNFILFLPFLFIPGFVLLFMEYKKSHRLNWLLLFTQLCVTLFLAYLFVPALHPIYHLLFLDKVANSRLFIGLGFVGAIQLLLILKSVEQLKFKKRTLNSIAGAYTIGVFAILWSVGKTTMVNYPRFIDSTLLVGFFAVFFAVILFCFLSNRRVLAAILFLVFTLGSVFHIHPLYVGLGPYYNGELTKAIDKVSKPGDAWVNLDNLVFENAPLVSNRNSISGLKPYPDLKFWRNVEGPRGDNVYNRYAHVYFSTSTTMTDQLQLIGADSFAVQFGCTDFVTKYVDYALADHALNYACVKEVDEVHYPAVTFYLYKIIPPSQ